MEPLSADAEPVTATTARGEMKVLIISERWFMHAAKQKQKQAEEDVEGGKETCGVQYTLICQPAINPVFMMVFISSVLEGC